MDTNRKLFLFTASLLFAISIMY